MQLRIRQYATFAVYSAVMSAADMTDEIGLTPDSVSVRGSKQQEPPRPVQHSWEVVCDTPGLDAGEQVELLVARLEPYKAAIQALVQKLGAAGGSVLQVVRYLDDPDGYLDDYQHRLLGWHLDRKTLRFLLDVGAEIDVDEYGQE